MTVDESSYRAAIGRFLTGVTLVTTRSADIAQGLTANSVASVSLQPPTLLVCVNRSSTTCEAIAHAAQFCINILSAEQAELARVFSSRGSDKFAESAALGHAWLDTESGLPRLADALATLECRVSDYSDARSHRIFFGEVLRVTTTDAEPLGYYRGGFRQLAAPRS